MYEPKSAKNITELSSVSVDLAILEESGTDKEGEPYTYKYIGVNGKDLGFQIQSWGL